MKIKKFYYGAQSSAVDGNYFAGTVEDMRKYFGVGDVAEPTEPSDAEKLAKLWEAHTELH